MCFQETLLSFQDIHVKYTHIILTRRDIEKTTQGYCHQLYNQGGAQGLTSP